MQCACRNVSSLCPPFRRFDDKSAAVEQNNTTDITKHGPLKVLQDFLSKLDVDFNDDGSINTDDNFLKEFYEVYEPNFYVF